MVHTITFEPSGKIIKADESKYPYGSHGLPGSILDVALANDVRIDHACGGVGACGTCHVIVLEGRENLSDPTEDELDRLDICPGVTPTSRLACMAVVQGDVKVRIPAWNRNMVSEKD